MKFRIWLEETTVINQLADFITVASKKLLGGAKWLKDDTMQVYVRKSTRLIEDQRMEVLDIANIEVYNKGQGIGGQFFKQAHEINPWQATYFENLMNPNLEKHLLKIGYKQDPGHFPPCYYKLK